MKDDQYVKHRRHIASKLKKGGPISITITDPEDALFIAEAILLRVSHGNLIWATDTLIRMGQWIQKAGIEKSMEMFFEELTLNGFKFPSFSKPLFIHILKQLNPTIKN